ncbi:MAG: DUF4968 domain-containing protein [Bacteroidales bacterium]|nr:DUF4968 domain-containing protein [Bacteroidales bacterium]
MWRRRIGSGYVKNEKGVEVNVKATGEKVRLQVFGDRIIRVSATKDNAFKDPQSLAVVAQKCQPEFRVEQSGDTVKVITNALRANVLTSSGKVIFTDLNGNILLSEADGGRTFEPYQVTQTHADGKPETYKGWSYRQVFDSPDDEAIYGLGQHQADDWNYKGKNEELFQYKHQSLCAVCGFVEELRPDVRLVLADEVWQSQSVLVLEGCFHAL